MQVKNRNEADGGSYYGEQYRIFDVKKIFPPPFDFLPVLNF